MNITDRKPTHPGEILREEFMQPLGISISAMAIALQVTRPVVKKLVSGRSQMTTDLALRLSIVCDTSPDFWLNLQRKVDVWTAVQNNEKYATLQCMPRGDLSCGGTVS